MGRICDVNMEGIRRLVEEQNVNLVQVLKLCEIGTVECGWTEDVDGIA